MRALQYSLEEALKSLWRGRQSGLLSTTTIALALFVLGGFLSLTANLDRLGAEWAGAAEMSVYLKDQVTPGERRAIEAVLAPGEIVAGHEYVSKKDALIRFQQTFADVSSTLDGLGDNPLPASYEVRLRSGPAVHAAIDVLAASLRQTPGVADVRYDRQWLTRLLSAIGIIRGAGLVLGSILTLAAALTVANVVRLALYARRDELEIMQLVGAPQPYIRGPFIMEGVFQGGLGAFAALGALAVAFLALRGPYFRPLASALSLSSIRFLPLELSVGLVLGGMAVGCVGGLLAGWSK
jgi:cell division transport system permease protein